MSMFRGKNSLIELQYVKKSLCSCGFPVLDENVSLGKSYMIDPNSKKEMKMKCGGCGATVSVSVVTVYEFVARLDNQEEWDLYIPKGLIVLDILAAKGIVQ